MVKYGEIIEFNSTKQLKHIRSLGFGGTGDTHLFEDEITNMLFAIKKYSPKGANSIEENYKRFVDEIKILFQVTHTNIVRIYNYYLYPEFNAGYLQMEFVEGVTIDEFEPNIWGKNWADIFKELISAFYYLEQNGILHRDIRPANILIDKEDNVKVIDFGFGKQLSEEVREGKSVLLNWPVTHLPHEITKDSIYNHQSEIYFLGKLVSNILREELAEFKFVHILNKMIELDPLDRYSTFEEINSEISKGILGEIDFTKHEKRIYTKFANALASHISHYIDKYSPVDNLNITLTRLEDLIRNSALEEYVQDNNQLIRCFIKGGYSYKSITDIEVETVTDFYSLLNNLAPYKQGILLDNISTRLAKIRIQFNSDDLPF